MWWRQSPVVYLEVAPSGTEGNRCVMDSGDAYAMAEDGVPFREKRELGSTQAGQGLTWTSKVEAAYGQAEA
ncbi:uncharacterized protein FFFS_15787 [Fusarium fujikuroi]|nr:uncharacterized protein FFFS_15787 [Fusarium fujikuroi]